MILRSRRRGSRSSFFSHLARDTRGNTLVLVGAAFIPLTAMVGSAVDIGRAYMAKNRLQNACDAAALAGRRAMHGFVDAPVAREATKFFNYNFPQASYQTAAFSPVITQPDETTVRVSARTEMPTSVMRIFGFDMLPLNVTCEASQKLVNTDIMLVLDITGSMDDPAGAAPSSKIEDLREAVLALYKELKPVQDQLARSNLRLRYGILPYSSAVNVGKLIYAVNPDYIVDQWTYQSRVAVMSGGIVPAFSHWVHQPRLIDTSQYKTGARTLTPTEKPKSTQSSTWKGCIEERDTVSSITASSGYNPPAAAADLDINLIPDSDRTRWRPLWPQVEYFRSTDAPEVFDGRDGDHTEKKSDDWVMNKRWSCPAEAAPLQEWPEGQFRSYIKGLTVDGDTYHDIGMIWGARLISPRGIFKANNPDSYHNMPISRHIIFMTDGIIEPNEDYYTAYGIEVLDRRVGGQRVPTDLDERHEQRFRMACYAAKRMDISVWVVSFASALTPALTECASSPSQASRAADREDLIKKFREIGKNIGALRISK